MFDSLLQLASSLGWLTAPASFIAIGLAMTSRWEPAKTAAWGALVACLLASIAFWSDLAKSFAAVAFAEPADKSAVLSHGISQALFGLTLKILPVVPAILVLFQHRRRAKRIRG